MGIHDAPVAILLAISAACLVARITFHRLAAGAARHNDAAQLVRYRRRYHGVMFLLTLAAALIPGALDPRFFTADPGMLDFLILIIVWMTWHAVLRRNPELLEKTDEMIRRYRGGG